MITSKKEYYIYLETDRKSLELRFNIKNLLFNKVWRFQRLLRHYEYRLNCRNKGINKIINLWFFYRYRKIGSSLNFTIAPNVFGAGLSIAHYGTIVINDSVRIGRNCRIHTCTNIGRNVNEKNTPVLGDNVYIGPGAVIFGEIKIADNVYIGANAVVNKSILQANVVIAGVPAKIISTHEFKRVDYYDETCIDFKERNRLKWLLYSIFSI